MAQNDYGVILYMCLCIWCNKILRANKVCTEKTGIVREKKHTSLHRKGSGRKKGTRKWWWKIFFLNSLLCTFFSLSCFTFSIPVIFYWMHRNLISMEDTSHFERGAWNEAGARITAVHNDQRNGNTHWEWMSWNTRWGACEKSRSLTAAGKYSLDRLLGRFGW